MQPQQMQQDQQARFLDMYRTGLRTATDLMKSSLESAERLQQQQFRAIRSVLEENAKAADQLSEVKSMEELMAVQSRLAGSQMERMMSFWSGIWRAAGEGQSMIRSMQPSEPQREAHREQPHPQRKTA